jgi:hypothetical protein
MVLLVMLCFMRKLVFHYQTGIFFFTTYRIPGRIHDSPYFRRVWRAESSLDSYTLCPNDFAQELTQ